MKQTTADKLQKKREQFISRTAIVLQLSVDETEHMLSMKRQQSFRINSIKVQDKSVVLKQLEADGWDGHQYDWYADGYTIGHNKRLVSDHQLASDGAVYVQNAASWLPVLVLDPRPDQKILDMCAAPGGKAAHILELTHNQAEVWVNDNSRPRMSKMLANFRRLGVMPAQTSLFDVSRLASKIEGEEFDKILLDAPCSGEGMIQIQNDKDMVTWSVAHIKRLQNLQKQAITQTWRLLKPGGTLVYSTCTMAPEENEAVIDYALRKLDGCSIEPIHFDLPNKVNALGEWNGKVYSEEVKNCLRLQPSEDIEAFFVAKLIKH